jgi:hypothetical protein
MRFAAEGITQSIIIEIAPLILLPSECLFLSPYCLIYESPTLLITLFAFFVAFFEEK